MKEERGIPERRGNGGAACGRKNDLGFDWEGEMMNMLMLLSVVNQHFCRRYPKTSSGCRNFPMLGPSIGKKASGNVCFVVVIQ